MANETYLNNVDTQKVSFLMEETGKNVEYFNSVSAETAEKYTKHLDVLMKELYKTLVKPSEVPTSVLEQNVLELTNLIYFMGDKIESLGVFDDMSGAAAKEVYNKAYLDYQVKDAVDKKNKTTVAECTAVAEQSAQYETVVNSIYEHAYKIVKFKIEAAYKMVDVLRKIISHRMQEESLSAYNTPKSFVDDGE
jgi:sRNA-binding carbon storage regulator CsrA